jgi:hypothetical protein
VGTDSSTKGQVGQKKDSRLEQDEAQASRTVPPFNYLQTLYKNLHNLRQVGSVDEYTEKFYELMARVDLQEKEEQMVARYLSGLKPPIQDSLVLYVIFTVSEAYNRALVVEKQLARKALQYQSFGRNQTTASTNRPGQQPWQSKNGQPYAATSTSSSAATKNPSSSKFPTSSTSFKCYKCGGEGHKANECKKGGLTKIKTRMVETMDEDELADQSMDIEDEVKKKLEAANAKYKATVYKYRKEVIFKLGNLFG